MLIGLLFSDKLIIFFFQPTRPPFPVATGSTPNLSINNSMSVPQQLQWGSTSNLPLGHSTPVSSFQNPGKSFNNQVEEPAHEPVNTVAPGGPAIHQSYFPSSLGYSKLPTTTASQPSGAVSISSGAPSSGYQSAGYTAGAYIAEREMMEGPSLGQVPSPRHSLVIPSIGSPRRPLSVHVSDQLCCFTLTHCLG